MDPIETLRNEHGLIRRFIGLLAKAAARLEVDRPPPRSFFDMGIEFVSGFSDGFHHRKEELVMFVRLAQKRDGAIDGQIEALRYQHHQGRRLMAALARALDGYAAGIPSDTAIVRENTAAFASLLEHHIHTEEQVFFPMVRESMTRGELDVLANQFAAEGERHEADIFERSRRLLVDLDAMLGPD